MDWVVWSIQLSWKLGFSFFEKPGCQFPFVGASLRFTDLTTLDISVLGRDITDNFAVIVDRPQAVISMLGQRHSYRVMQT